MTQFKTQQDRDAAAQALGYQQRKPTQWTNIPPAITGRQVEGASILPIGRYEMPDGSSQVSFGLPQGPLDAYRSMRYGLGFEQDPDAPPGYMSEGAMTRGAFGAAGAAATGGIAATAAARAAGRPMVPRGALGSNADSSARYAANQQRMANADTDSLYQTVYRQGDAVGTISGRRVGQDEAKIDSSLLDGRLRGQGIGIDLYRHLIDRLHKDGRHVKSDSLVSDDASKVYEALKRLGYDVRKNPNIKRVDDNRSYSDTHVYRVAKPGTPSDEFFSSGIPGLHATEDEY